MQFVNVDLAGFWPTSSRVAERPPEHPVDAGNTVLVLVNDLHIRVIANTGQLLRELTLDPSRDYQPQPPQSTMSRDTV